MRAEFYEIAAVWGLAALFALAIVHVLILRKY